jgi:hypothetical protein
MRISYICPAHLKFGLTVEQWTSLVQLTGEAIDWLDAHERTYDVWLLVAYAATSCALVQVRLSMVHFPDMSPDLPLSSSIIHGHGARTRRRQASYENCVIACGDGRDLCRLNICQRDARPVYFYIHPGGTLCHFSRLTPLSHLCFPTDGRDYFPPL